VTVREEQRNKLEQMASLENRSLSYLIEVMADETLGAIGRAAGHCALIVSNSRF
jgi:hypothetical protein